MIRSTYAVTVGMTLLSSLAGCSAFQQIRQCGAFSECPGDAKITTEVEERLREHPSTQQPNVIYVSTFNRVVYINGDVDTRSAKDEAELIALEAPGVTDVVNSIVGQVP